MFKPEINIFTLSPFEVSIPNRDYLMFKLGKVAEADAVSFVSIPNRDYLMFKLIQSNREKEKDYEFQSLIGII